MMTNAKDISLNVRILMTKLLNDGYEVLRVQVVLEDEKSEYSTFLMREFPRFYTGAKLHRASRVHMHQGKN
jgi:hypothetical protein